MQLRKLQHNISKLHLSINKQQQKNHTIQQKTTRQQSSTISLQNDESQIARSLVLSAVTKNNSNNNNHKYNSHLQRIIRTALPMWAASTWQQRRSLLQRLERFLLQHKELQSAPMGMQIAAFITASTTTRPSTKLSYGKQLRALAKKTGTTSTPVLDLVLSGLSVTASSAEIHQATPATKQQIITLMKSLKERQSTSHTRLALALFLAWKTASRWSDIVALKKKNVLEITATQAVIEWGETKTTRRDRFRPTGWTVVEEKKYPALLIELQQQLDLMNDNEPLTTTTTAQLRQLFRSNPATQQLTAHSIKRGALDVLLTAAANKKLDPRLIPLLAKHKDCASQFPATTIRYLANKPNLARMLGTQKATKLL